jgi:superfamily II DNA or RNA helicase
MPFLLPRTISEYLKHFADELGDRVLEQFPPLHKPGDTPSALLRKLKRQPFPGQQVAVNGILKKWQDSRAVAAIAECGTGKTLIALASVYAAAEGRGFTAIAMVPPQLVMKWARECFLTIPGVRVFVIDGVRNGVASNGHTGVNEVRFRQGRIDREGLKTTLSDLRLAHGQRSARVRWTVP